MQQAAKTTVIKYKYCPYIKILLSLLAIDLQIEHSSYQYPNDVYWRNRKSDPQIYMKPQETLDSQDSL